MSIFTFHLKIITLIRCMEIEFFTLVHVSDLRVPQTLLALLTVSLRIDAVAFLLLGLFQCHSGLGKVMQWLQGADAVDAMLA